MSEFARILSSNLTKSFVGLAVMALVACDDSTVAPPANPKLEAGEAQSHEATETEQIRKVLRAYLDGLAGKDNPMVESIFCSDARTYWVSPASHQVNSKALSSRRDLFDRCKQLAKDPAYWQAIDQQIEFIDYSGWIAAAKFSWVSRGKNSRRKHTNYVLLSKGPDGWAIVAETDVGLLEE